MAPIEDYQQLMTQQTASLSRFNYFSSIPYPKFKLAIVVLIVLNVVNYAMVDTMNSAVDGLSWLALLVLYVLEANKAIALADNTLHRMRYILIAVIATQRCLT